LWIPMWKKLNKIQERYFQVFAQSDESEWIRTIWFKKNQVKVYMSKWNRILIFDIILFYFYQQMGSKEFFQDSKENKTNIE
jgi:hypothetical protein